MIPKLSCLALKMLFKSQCLCNKCIKSMLCTSNLHNIICWLRINFFLKGQCQSLHNPSISSREFLVFQRTYSSVIPYRGKVIIYCHQIKEKYVMLQRKIYIWEINCWLSFKKGHYNYRLIHDTIHKILIYANTISILSAIK